jgi:hypothetical protein
MKPETWIGIAQIIITIIGMIVGPWLAVRWSLRRFRSEKWWERQEEAYGTLLGDLVVAKQYLFEAWEGLVRQQPTPNDEMTIRYRKACSDIELQVYAGPYLLSEETIKTAKTFLGQIDTESNDYAGHLRKCTDSVTYCVDVVREEAKKQLSH